MRRPFELSAAALLLAGSSGCETPYESGCHPDGLIDHLTLYTYDGGLLVRVDQDEPGSGHDYALFYTYDQGRLITIDTVTSGDAVSSRETRSYDSAGQLIRREIDTPASEGADYAYTYAYENGDLVQEALTTLAGPADPTSGDYVREYTWDDAHRLATKSEDRLADGTIDEVWTYSYDPQGTLIQYVDLNDGVDTTLHTFVYRDDDLAAEVIDQGGDGLAESRIEYTWEAGTHRLLEVRTVSLPSTVDSVSTYTYDGDQVSRVIDDGGDGFIEAVETSTYNGDGQLVRFEVDDSAGYCGPT